MRNLGQLLMTQGIHSAIKESPTLGKSLQYALHQFQNNDWGNTCKEDARMNDLALDQKDRVLAVYSTLIGDIWITTEFYPRAYYEECFGPSSEAREYLPVTTILLPSEY